MNTNEIIALRNITFSFLGQAQSFFKSLNIDFMPRGINFIQGKNGVGKSTLLQILSGKNNHNNKQIQGQLLLGDQLYHLSDFKNIVRLIAFVPQKFQELLVDAYSFYENLQFARMTYPGWQPLPIVHSLPDLVQKYGINDQIPISMLSGGQRRILSILMVLQQSPKILLLDEPTAALDEENAKLLMDFLQDLCDQQNLTVIAIVHDHELVKNYAQDCYFELYQENGVRDMRRVMI